MSEPESGSLIIRSDGMIATRNKKDYCPKKSQGPAPLTAESGKPVVFTQTDGSTEAYEPELIVPPPPLGRSQISRTPVGLALSQLPDIRSDSFSATHHWENLRDGQPQPKTTDGALEEAAFDIDSTLTGLFDQLRQFRRHLVIDEATDDEQLMLLRELTIHKENTIIGDILTQLGRAATDLAGTSTQFSTELAATEEQTHILGELDRRVAGERSRIDEFVSREAAAHEDEVSRHRCALEMLAADRASALAVVDDLYATVQAEKSTLDTMRLQRDELRGVVDDARARLEYEEEETATLQATLEEVLQDTRRVRGAIGRVEDAIGDARGALAAGEGKGKGPEMKVGRGMPGPAIAGVAGAVVVAVLVLIIALIVNIM